MSDQGPKLYTTKPKKSKLKPSPPAAAVMASSASSAGATAAPPPPPPTPTPVRESFVRRYKYLWPALLAVNFGVGAYVLTRTTGKKEVAAHETDESPNVSKPAEVAAATTTATPVAPTATPVIPPVAEPLPPTPVPKDQQQALFKWILEEKRKLKPRDPEEKKRIDEEKAILKQFIRSKSALSF